ncbi:MAG: hypothetical protein JWR39_694, partial [Devosia sp.]|nr:hypothetical protein [Devosia sp.]
TPVRVVGANGPVLVVAPAEGSSHDSTRAGGTAT